MFFLFIGLLFGSSQEVSIEFYNTVIEMPLGSNPYDYVEIPYAVVMKDDQPIEDARIIYERGVERTFLSVLHTKRSNRFTSNIEHMHQIIMSIKQSRLHLKYMMIFRQSSHSIMILFLKFVKTFNF
jgi:hypothetical protein